MTTLELDTISSATTRGVRVEVQSAYIPERSQPDRGVFFFAYHIRITNEGEETVQLLSRHWIITNGNGKIEEVKGPGVVGEQPVLETGESFEYSSFCPLNTSSGTMQGTYQMSTEDGETFEAQIAPFLLKDQKITYH